MKKIILPLGKSPDLNYKYENLPFLFSINISITELIVQVSFLGFSGF